MTLEELQVENEKLKSRNTDLASEAASRRKSLREAQDELKNFEGVNVEEYRTMKDGAKTKEEDALRAKGDIDAIQSRMKKEHDASVKQLSDKYDTLERSYNNEVIDKALIASFAAGRAISPYECATLVKGRCARDEQGAYIMGDDGSPLLKDGKRVTLGDFAKDWLTSRPHHVQAGSSGSGSQGGGKSGDGKTISREQFEDMPHNKRAEFFKSGGNVE